MEVIPFRDRPLFVSEHAHIIFHFLSFCLLGSLVVNYPYDDNLEDVIGYSRSSDDDVFKMLALAYSQVYIAVSDYIFCVYNGLTSIGLMYFKG